MWPSCAFWEKCTNTWTRTALSTWMNSRSSTLLQWGLLCRRWCRTLERLVGICPAATLYHVLSYLYFNFSCSDLYPLALALRSSNFCIALSLPSSVSTASEAVQHHREWADGRPPVEQGADSRHSDHRLYTWEMGHHHPQEWREDIYSASHPRHHCEHCMDSTIMCLLKETSSLTPYTLCFICSSSNWKVTLICP